MRGWTIFCTIVSSSPCYNHHRFRSDSASARMSRELGRARGELARGPSTPVMRGEGRGDASRDVAGVASSKTSICARPRGAALAVGPGAPVMRGDARGDGPRVVAGVAASKTSIWARPICVVPDPASGRDGEGPRAAAGPSDSPVLPGVAEGPGRLVPAFFARSLRVRRAESISSARGIPARRDTPGAAPSERTAAVATGPSAGGS